MLLLCVAGAYLWGRHDGSAMVGAADVAPSTVGGLSSTATNALRRFRGGGNDAGASQSGEKLTLKEVETTMGEYARPYFAHQNTTNSREDALKSFTVDTPENAFIESSTLNTHGPIMETTSHAL